MPARLPAKGKAADGKPGLYCGNCPLAREPYIGEGMGWGEPGGLMLVGDGPGRWN